MRSASDGRVFDMLDEVSDRYLKPGRKPSRLRVWKSDRHIKAISRDSCLRVLATEPFTVHWSSDEWQHADDTASSATPIDFHYDDINAGTAGTAPIRFPFNWRQSSKWEAATIRL